MKKKWGIICLFAVFAVLLLITTGKPSPVHAEAEAGGMCTGRVVATNKKYGYGVMSFSYTSLTDNEEHVAEYDSGKSAFLFNVPVGKYKYKVMYKRGVQDEEVKKEGTIEFKESNIGGTKWIYFYDYTFSFNTNASSGNYGGIVSELRDSDENLIETCETYSKSVPGGRGYEEQVFILRAGKDDAGNSTCDYTYYVDSYSEKYEISELVIGADAERPIQNLSMKSTMSDRNKKYTLQKANTGAVTTVLVTKGVGLKAYRHLNAYTVMNTIEPDEVDKTSNNDYDIYKFQMGRLINVDLVAGGEGTDYKRTFVELQTDALGRNQEITMDCEKKDSEPSKYEYHTLFTQADLYTNVRDGLLQIDSGESAKLEGFRVTQLAHDSITDRFTEPDFHYDILYQSVDGLISINPYASEEFTAGEGRRIMEVKAAEDKTGFAVVKVTYDEMNFAMNSSGMRNVPAVDNERAGIVIVKVGGNKVEPGFHGMTIKTRSAANKDIVLRNDFDTIYFLGDLDISGINEDDEKAVVEEIEDTPHYDYTVPEGITAVAVHDPVYADTMVWTDNWTTCAISEEDRSCTIPLKAGRNIVRLTQNGENYYTIINARKLDVTVKNDTNPGKKPKEGDSLTISFGEKQLVLPVYKMATIYNPGYPATTWLEYTANQKGSQTMPDGYDGVWTDTMVQSRHTQYAIESRTITVTVGDGDYVLSDGQIHGHHLGQALYAHTAIPLEGRKPDFSASGGENDPYFGILPDIVIPVSSPVQDVIDTIKKLPLEDELTLKDMEKVEAAREAYDALEKEEDQNKVTNYDKLQKLEKKLEELGTAAVKEVTEKIDAIGDADEITEENLAEKKEAVKEAETLYEALPEKLRGDVENHEKLKAASDKIAELEGQSKEPGEDQAVKAVVDKIEAIGDADGITAANLADKKKAAEEARDLYSKLTEEQKAQVTNLSKLEAAEAKIAELEAQSKDPAEDQAVKAVMDKIEAIGEITAENLADKKKTVEAARALYKELTGEQQKQVTNLAKLEAAEKKVAELEAEEPAKAAMEKIEALGEITIANLTDKEKAVSEARTLYDALKEDQKKQVTNLDKLTAAEKKVKDLKAAKEVVDAITAIGEVTEANHEGKQEQVKEARKLYDKLTDDQKRLVTNADALAKAEYGLDYYKLDENVKGVVGEIEKLENGPLASDTSDWTDWKDWVDDVQNLRGVVDLLDKDNQADISNLSALAAAEKKVKEVRVSRVTELIRGLASPSTVDAYDSPAMPVAEVMSVSEPMEISGDPEIAGEAMAAAAGRQMTQAQLRAVAEAVDAYEMLSSSEKAMVQAVDLEKLTQLEAKAVTYTGEVNYAKEVLSVYVQHVEEYYAKTADNTVTQAKLATAKALADRYESFPAEWKEQLSELSDSKGGPAAELVGTFTGQAEKASAEVSEIKELDAWIKSLPTPQEIKAGDVADLVNEVSNIESRLAVLSADAKQYVSTERYDALKSLVDMLKELAGGLGQEIEDPDTPLGGLPIEEETPEVTAKSSGYKSVTVTWSEVNGAESYYIYRQKKGKGSYTKIAAVDGTETSYTDKNLITNRVYRYKVRAMAKTEAGTAVYSKYGVSAKVKPVPAKASITKITAGKRYLKATWKKVSGASGYVVYRAASKNGKYKAVKTIKSGKTVSWKNNGLTGGKTYYYKVRAYRTVSGKKVYGSYSAKASGKAKK